MSNIVEFKRPSKSLLKIDCKVETQIMDDGSLWMRILDPKTERWSEWINCSLN